MKKTKKQKDNKWLLRVEENRRMNEVRSQTKICSICKGKYIGWGNNAYPINNGRCCDSCNNQVLFERLSMINKKVE